MRTRFVAYDRLGPRRGELPNVLSAEFVPSKNELPTLRLQYPRNTPRAPYLDNEPEVAYEYWNPSTEAWVEPFDARFKLASVDHDYLEEVQTRAYSFIGIGEAIRGIYVFDSGGLPVNDEGKVQFVASNAGAMMSHVWDKAVARGWKGFTKSFSATKDSSGVAWDTTLNLSFAMDTSLDGMLNYLMRLGLVDFRWQGRTLHAYNAHTTMAQDKSVGANAVRFSLSGGPASVDSAPELRERENLATHVVVNGEEGLRWVFPTGKTLPEGRREVFVSYSGVDDEGTAQVLAAPIIARYSNELTNTTRQFRITRKTKLLPNIHYNVGDWVLVEKDNGEWEKVQIFQLSVLVNQNGVQGYVSLGDKIDSLLEKLNEKVQRVQGGVLNEGTEPPAPSTRVPSAPLGLVATLQTLLTNNGDYQVLAGVNFSHNGQDIKGDPVEITQYVVQYRAGNGTWADLFTLDGGSQAGTHSWLRLKDKDGVPITYSFRVKAVSNRGMVSDWSNVSTVTAEVDEVPPGKPKAPVMTVDHSVFIASVDHKQHNNDNQPADYAHTVIQMSTSSTGTFTDAGSIVPPLKQTWISSGGYVTRWFRAIAVDYQGNRSDPSDVVSATTKPLVDADIILTEIDASKTVIKNAGELFLDSTTTLAKEFTDLNFALDNVTGKLDPIEGAIRDINNTTIPNLQLSINGKNSTYNSTADASGNTYAEGDTWQKWSSLGVGGKLLASWRFRNKAWVAEIMDPTYLPLIDIGAGTFNSLAGGRLEASSVSTRELLVGSFSNLLENGSFDLGDKNWSKVTGFTFEPTGGRIGPGVLKCTGITSRVIGPISANFIANEAKDSYRVSAWVRTTATAGHRGEVCLYWYSPDGTYLSNKNLTIDTATSEWQYYSWITSIPETAYQFKVRVNANMANATDEYYFDDVQIVKATDGRLVVDGSITGNHVEAESVAAKIGSILKLYSNQVIIGQPNNILPDPMFMDAGMLARRDLHSTCTVTLSTEGDYALTASATAYFRPLGVAPTQAGVLSNGWVSVKPGEVWTWGLTVSQMKVAGWIQFVGRTMDGSATANTNIRTIVPVGSGTYSVSIKVPENCYWIMPEMMIGAGTQWVKRGTMIMSQVIDSSLIVEGAILTKHLKVTEDMTVELLKAHKVLVSEIDINSLTADTGFISSLRTKVLVTDSVKSTMIEGDAITSKHTLTGPLYQTHAAALTGIKINTSGIIAYDAGNIETFRLNATNGQVKAVGVFQALGSDGSYVAITNSGYNNRPQLIMHSGVNSGIQAGLFSTGTGDGLPGSITMHSRELVANSSGRGQITLGVGGSAFIGNTGSGGQIADGVYVSSAGISFNGRLSYRGSTFNHTFMAGYALGTMIQPNGYAEWRVSARHPDGNGKRNVSVTPNTDGKVTTTIHDVQSTGFSTRAWNVGVSSCWSSIEYVAIWGAG